MFHRQRRLEWYLRAGRPWFANSVSGNRSRPTGFAGQPASRAMVDEMAEALRGTLTTFLGRGATYHGRDASRRVVGRSCPGYQSSLAPVSWARQKPRARRARSRKPVSSSLQSRVPPRERRER